MAIERADPRHPGFKNGVYKQRFVNRYSFCKNYVKDKIVLDIPCGMGWGTSIIQSFNSLELYGIDISEQAIKDAKLLYNNINFYTGSLLDIPFNNKFFDVVIYFDGYEHLKKEDQIKSIIEIRRVLKPDGVVLFDTLLAGKNGEQSGNPYHIWEPFEYELDEIFTKYFNKYDKIKTKGPDATDIRCILSSPSLL